MEEFYKYFTNEHTNQLREKGEGKCKYFRKL